MHIASVRGSDPLELQCKQAGLGMPSKKAMRLHQLLINTSDSDERETLQAAFDLEMQHVLKRSFDALREIRNFIEHQCARELHEYERVVNEVGIDRAAGDMRANNTLRRIHDHIGASRQVTSKFEDLLDREPSLRKTLAHANLSIPAQEQRFVERAQKKLNSIKERRDGRDDALSVMLRIGIANAVSEYISTHSLDDPAQPLDRSLEHSLQIEHKK